MCFSPESGTTLLSTRTVAPPCDSLRTSLLCSPWMWAALLISSSDSMRPGKKYLQNIYNRISICSVGSRKVLLDNRKLRHLAQLSPKIYIFLVLKIIELNSTQYPLGGMQNEKICYFCQQNIKVDQFSFLKHPELLKTELWARRTSKSTKMFFCTKKNFSG